MKTSMNQLRAWMAAGSFAAFMGGWILLAQAGAPAATESPAAVTVEGTAPSQATSVQTTATAPALATSVLTKATAAATSAQSKPAATSTPRPTATPTQATTVKPKLRTGASR